MKATSPAPIYAQFWIVLSEEARACGYALALHGTLGRDLDVLACPWTDAAVSAEELVRRLAEKVAWSREEDGSPFTTGPVSKPHGRRSWSIPLGAGLSVDLSVMPLAPEAA